MNQVRVVLGLYLVLGLVAWAAWDTWRVLRLYPWSPDQVVNDVPSFDARCAEVRDQLPARGAVGYRNRVRQPPWDQRGDRQYALAQYALVPLTVVRDADRTPAVEVSGRVGDPRVRVVPAGP